jgi:subtilisin family serine protease
LILRLRLSDCSLLPSFLVGEPKQRSASCQGIRKTASRDQFLISVFCLIVILGQGACTSVHRVDSAKEKVTITASLKALEKRPPGTVDGTHVVLTLEASQSNTATLEYLNSVLEPYKAPVTAGQTVAQVLEREFGTDRADLVAIVKRLNEDLFKELQERGELPEQVPIKNATMIVLPDLPLRTTTITAHLFGESDLYRLAERYYPSVPFRFVDKILAKNPQILDPRDLVYGDILLPDVPVPRLVKLQDYVVISPPQGRYPAPPSHSLPMYASAVASVHGQRGAVADASLNSQVETPVNFSLSAQGGCDTPATSDWFLDQMRVRDVHDSDLQLNGTFRVAVIDSGIDTDHPAFKDKLYQPKYEEFRNYDRYSNQKLGIDVTDVSKVFPTDVDPHSHGTHVSGLAAGVTVVSQSKEMEKAGKTVELLVIKITKDLEENTNNYFIGEAIKAGRRNGAKIFNLSFSAPWDYTIDDAFILDISPDLYVIAAGNGKEIVKDSKYDVINLDEREDFFPAFVGGQHLTGSILIVAATLPSGEIAPFSNYGQQKVEIAAPGACIFSTVRHQSEEASYGFLSGTSQAAPFVTFASALLAANGRHLSAESVKQRLLSSCDWEPSARQFVKNGCELNIGKALAMNTDIVELRGVASKPTTATRKGLVIARTEPVNESSCPGEALASDSVRRPGRLLRGQVQNSKFTLRRERKGSMDLPVGGRMRRIWFGDDEPLQSVLVGSKPPVCGIIEGEGDTVRLRLEGGMACPYRKSDSGDCLIPLKDVRDIVFRKPSADDY